MDTVFNSTVQESPNPLTPMAFLPPALAYATTVGTYFHVGALGVLIWDILQNLRNDYRMITKYRIGLPTVVYFSARITMFAFALGRAIVITLPIGNCKRWDEVVYSLCAVTLILTELLFYIRVCAVYEHNKYIISFFGVSWLVVIATSCASPFLIIGEPIVPTKYCIEKIVNSYSLVPPITLLINDTLVFLATSFKLYRLYSDEGNRKVSSGLRMMVFGARMPAFSRAFLHENQLYYLAVPISKLVVLISILVLQSNDYAPLIRLLIPTHAILVTLIACNVFRNTKLGLTAEPTTLNCADLTNGMPIHFLDVKNALPAGNVDTENQSVIYTGPNDSPAEFGAFQEGGDALVVTCQCQRHPIVIRNVDFPTAQTSGRANEDRDT